MKILNRAVLGDEGVFLKEADIKITLGRIASKFMADIQVAIEGEDAIAATEELLAIPGISGDYTVNTEAPERETVVATVATIVGIVGGAIAIAEQIRKWYQEYQGKQSGKRIEKVLIVGRNGRRLLLKNPTLEEIRQILES